MTPEEWEGVASEVLAGIVEAGTVGYIVQPGTMTGPEDNPTRTDPTEHAVQIVYSKWSAREIDGTVIMGTDMKLLMAAGGVEPQVNWKFRKEPGGKDYELVPPLQVVQPGGVPVLYILNARR